MFLSAYECVENILYAVLQIQVNSMQNAYLASQFPPLVAAFLPFTAIADAFVALANTTVECMK